MIFFAVYCELIKLFFGVTALPNITLQPAPVTFKAGDQNVVAMYCKAITHGVTPIYYQWERYHSLSNSWIRPSQRAVNITSPQLEFSIIMEEDEGAYRCIAANDDGSVTSENATISVYGECSHNHICISIILC